MDKPKSRYSYESRSKDFTRHGSLQAKRDESAPPGGSSGRPVDPRRAQPRGSFSLHHSFRIPKKDGSSSRSAEAGRSKISSWASRWDNRAPRERREVRDKHSSRIGRAYLSEDRESSVKKGYMEGCETGSDEELQGRESGAKSVRPSSLCCGSERGIRKRAQMDRHISFAEAKRRRAGDSNEEEGGAHKSVRARLSQDRDKVFQLGTKQPTEVATVLGPLSGSPPYSSAQRGTSEVSSAVHH